MRRFEQRRFGIQPLACNDEVDLLGRLINSNGEGLLGYGGVSCFLRKL